MNSKFSVSFHDLKPSNLPICQIAVELLREFEIPCPAMGVIPLWKETQFEQERFKNWMQEQNVLWLIHGFQHQSNPGLHRSLWGRTVQKITQNEAEFAGLSAKPCFHVLHSAIQAAQEIPVFWSGFVPPTWHAPQGLKSLVHQQGLRFYESRLWISTAEDSQFSFPLSFPVNSSDRIWLRSLRLALSLAKLRILPMRLVLHPSDFQNPWRIRQIRKFLQLLLALGSAMPYGIEA